MRRKNRQHLHLFGGAKVFSQRFHTLIRQPIFLFVTIWGHLAIVAGTFGFYYFEKGVNPRVQTLLDTFYWAIATVTTVGYGDASPITTGGKFVAIAMMILGSLFLWSYTALFAGGLVAPEIRMVEDEVRSLEGEFRGVEQEMKIDEQTARELLAEIRMLNKNILSKKQ